MAKRHKHKNRKQKQTAKDQPERIVVQDLDAFEVGEDLDDQSSVEPSKEILKQPQKAAQKQGTKRANDAKLTKTEVQETQPRETKGERAEEAVHNDARVEAAPAYNASGVSGSVFGGIFGGYVSAFYLVHFVAPKPLRCGRYWDIYW